MPVELKINDKINAIETIKIAPFRKNIRKTIAHKHNKYLELVYFTEGKGYHVIDNYKIEVNPSIFFVVRKEQVHFWNLETEPSGYVIIIKKSFIDNCLDNEIKLLISKITAFPYLYPEDKKSIEQLFQLLISEYESASRENNTIIEGLLKALLGKLLQSEKSSFTNSSTLYHKFIELLSQQNKFSNKVEYYANLLNTSPQNLNANCRNECEKSASEVLSDFVISEAKRLLLYTNLTIVEIAYTLSFNDNSHFTKYFKRHVNVTPSVFRQEAN